MLSETRSCYVAQAGLWTGDTPSSAYQVLGLQHVLPYLAVSILFFTECIMAISPDQLQKTHCYSKLLSTIINCVYLTQAGIIIHVHVSLWAFISPSYIPEVQFLVKGKVLSVPLFESEIIDHNPTAF
jgi:hypothetical protein